MKMSFNKNFSADKAFVEMLFGAAAGQFHDIHTTVPLPFSFLYEGVCSREFEKLMSWTVEITTQNQTVRHYRAETMVPDSRILLTVECKLYLDTAGLEWTLYFTNAGETVSGVLSNIYAFDFTEKLPDRHKSFLLRRLRGSNFLVDDWEPFDWKIAWKDTSPCTPKSITFGPIKGKSSKGVSPFFNIDWDDGGLLCAIGWTGQWKACVSHTGANECRVTAGMEHCHFVLYAGERVRSPRVLIMHWDGIIEDSYNGFRRIMLTHILPRVDGSVPLPPIAHLTTSFDKDPHTSGYDEVISHFSAASEAGFEVLWLDAFFHKGGFPLGMGNYGYPVESVVNAELFPKGIKPISDFAHEKNAEFLLWFEPERVVKGTLLEKEHPEWLVKDTFNDDVFSRENHMFNLGIPEACDFMTGFLAESIEKFGIDILRIDGNLCPLWYWLSDDKENGDGRRDGISEIKYVEGLYRMLDTLLARFPRLRIDNCASGGMRIDLEMCSRSYPLWRTDAVIFTILDGDLDLVALQNQLMSLGLNRYVPFSTSGTMGADPYHFRSGFNAGVSFGDDCRTAGYPIDLLKAGIMEGKRIRPCFGGNYYAITANAGISPESWCVMQYHLTVEDKGIVLAFRRHKSPYERAVCSLREIDRNAIYLVHISESYQQGDALSLNGAALQKLVLTIDKCPASVLVEYQKMPLSHA